MSWICFFGPVWLNPSPSWGVREIVRGRAETDARIGLFNYLVRIDSGQGGLKMI